MKLEINEQLYSYTSALEGYLDENESYPLGLKVIYKPITYIFDLDSYIVCKEGTEEAKSIERPLIFPSVTQIEVQKAYIKFLNNKKYNYIFKDLSDEDYPKVFWNYFDDGGEKYADYDMFERYYRIKKIIDWCEENYIPYYVNKKEKIIKWVLDYYKIQNFDL